jgi:transposase
MPLPPWPGRVFARSDLDRLIPKTHLVRRLHQALDFSPVEAARQAPGPLPSGRPPVDPEIIFRMLILGRFYGMTSERRLCEEIQVNLAFRWFVGLNLDDLVPDHSTLSRFRRRLGRDLYKRILDDISVQLKSFGEVQGR